MIKYLRNAFGYKLIEGIRGQRFSIETRPELGINTAVLTTRTDIEGQDVDAVLFLDRARAAEVAKILQKFSENGFIS
jgi:hypothetical protein